MWTFIVVISVIATVAVIGYRLAASPPTRPDPDEQPVDIEPAPGEYPDVADDETATRRDGRLMPGSEEYRNRDGQN